MHQVVLDGISYNIDCFAHTGKYGVINEAYTTRTVYHVLEYLPEPYTLQSEKTTYGKVGKVGDLSVKYEHLRMTKSKTNWYCKQN